MMRIPLTAALCLGFIPAVALAQSSGAPPGGPSGASSSVQADCARLATQQTGFDPARPPPPPAQASAQVAGSGSRMRGAAAGAMIGGAAGNAGTGAAAGAVAGGVAQRSRSRRSARQANETMAQQQQSGQAAYTQALNACLAQRGQPTP